jgi:hypothetical protein
MYNSPGTCPANLDGKSTAFTGHYLFLGKGSMSSGSGQRPGTTKQLSLSSFANSANRAEFSKGTAAPLRGIFDSVMMRVSSLKCESADCWTNASRERCPFASAILRDLALSVFSEIRTVANKPVRGKRGISFEIGFSTYKT